MTQGRLANVGHRRKRLDWCILGRIILGGTKISMQALVIPANRMIRRPILDRMLMTGSAKGFLGVDHATGAMLRAIRSGMAFFTGGNLQFSEWNSAFTPGIQSCQDIQGAGNFTFVQDAVMIQIQRLQHSGGQMIAGGTPFPALGKLPVFAIIATAGGKSLFIALMARALSEFRAFAIAALPALEVRAILATPQFAAIRIRAHFAAVLATSEVTTIFETPEVRAFSATVRTGTGVGVAGQRRIFSALSRALGTIPTFAVHILLPAFVARSAGFPICIAGIIRSIPVGLLSGGGSLGFL